MILDLLLSFVSFIFSALIGLLPTASPLPSEMTSAVSFFVSSLSAIDPILPVTSLLSAFSFALTFEVGVLGYRLTMLFLSFIRGNSMHK